ncbi:MAG: hypothetical protein L6Q35_03695 [Phycisphaerales bacterium]|nr:hypothetical protein [Phycisphaerales bacterium]
MNAGIQAAVLIGLAACAAQAQKVQFTYLWHLEQPIYWPDQQVGGMDRYETAWGSIQRKDAGAAHPSNNLRDIFGLDDRKAAYQYRIRDSIDAFDWAPRAGAQISYSGGLIENITSLGNAGQLGYSSTWYAPNRTARGWTTTGGKPRQDIVLFPFHHALLPLLDEDAVRKEIQLYKSIYPDAWGATPAASRGLFPSEMAFSARLIPVLASEGIAWTFVSSEKISRACPDFPVQYGSGGVNCDPPNRADQLNAPGVNWYRESISRGCGPAEAYPLAMTPRRAQYIDAATGAVSSIIVVPCSQILGWKDGYSPIGLGGFDTLQAHNPASRPQLVVLAHDGDNAWGGGYSYYMEATPNLVSQAQAAGYTATTVEQYLADYPVPAGDVVHVEDGAWVNADGDFGSPQMLNWNWPPVNATGQVDIANGWAEDVRNWAVITAAQNRVSTAEQIAGGVNIRRILAPDASTTPAERAWHYFLGALNSGYMYYGTAEDFEVKPTIACNEAVQHADAVIGAGTGDLTGPTVWIPQRYPWNPGSTNFGPLHGYKQVVNNGDFWIYTFAYDVSGIPAGGVTLKYRVDADGVNSTASAHNETYAGGPEVGAWQTVAMSRRTFPAGNVYNNPSIDFFEMPQYIADQYSIQLTGIRSALLDYYIEAVDARGNVRRSPIQHVWVGDGSGSSGGGQTVVISPNPAVAGEDVTITYDPAGRPLAGAPLVKLHYGFDHWQTVISPDLAMTLASGKWVITVPVASSATSLDMVFNNGSSTWDNNGGQDWHFPVQGGTSDGWTMDGVRDTGSVLVASSNGMSLWAGLKGSVLYVATNDAGEGNDHFIFVAQSPGALRAAPWAKSGQVAAWSAFLADENNNDYEGWFDAAGATQAATGANGGVLEGTIDLAGELGTIPASIALAVGPFATADGGALLWQYQVPATVNSNTTLDATEYIVIDLCSLTDAGCCPADFDGSGFVDLEDYDAFVLAFEAGGDDADFDASGFVDLEDFTAFVEAFELGCP